MTLKEYIEKQFDEILGRRHDYNNAMFYFSPENFNLKYEKFDFTGDNDVKLCGFFYYDKNINNDRVIFFDHGMGAGHRAYMREICLLARHGYTVFAYDHTGCGESGGENIVAFSQSLNDLDHAISAVKGDKRFENANISVIGHSWGGYAALNIGAFYHEITHIVSLSGFISAKEMIRQNLPFFMKNYAKEVFSGELRKNWNYANADARENLKRTNAKLMVIHSKDDKIVKYRVHFSSLFWEFKDRENTVFITVDGRGHNPNYTEDAAYRLSQMSDDYMRLIKAKKLTSDKEISDFKNSHDFVKITAQDFNLWNKIFNFLDN